MSWDDKRPPRKSRWHEPPTLQKIRTSLALCACLNAACSREPPDEDWRTPPTDNTAPVATSPDRLPPGELIEGTEDAFGIRVPKGMTLSPPSIKYRRFAGRVDFDQLTEYVRTRITAHHAELRRDALFFDNVRIKGGDPGRVYDVTLTNRPSERVVVIEDTTRPPANPNISSEERWKRAGLKPHGGLIDPNAME